MNSIEIYEFHYDEKTSDLLKKLSEENSSEISSDSVCFEEIEFSIHDEDDEKDLANEESSVEQTEESDYDSFDESYDDLEGELSKLCELESPWNNYARRELIGVGSSCRVYRAVEIENGREVAIKQMILEKQRSKQLTLNEICALKHLKSEKIIPLYGVYYSHCDLEGTMVVSIVTELCPMSLSKLIDSIILSEVTIRSILKSILIGLGCLHKNGIAHRDIKSDNILISPNGKVYVSDLGYCDAIEADGKCPSVGMVGTPHWMAPEVVNFGRTSLSSDIWSVGIVALEMAQGQAPLMSSHTSQQAIEAISQYRGGPIYNKWRLSQDFNHFLSRCFAPQQSRATFQELLAHPFLKNSKSENLTRYLTVAKQIQDEIKSEKRKL